MHSFDAPSGTTYHFNGDLSGDLVFREERIPVEDLVALLRHWHGRYYTDYVALFADRITALETRVAELEARLGSDL